jgi:hypothetical protein
MPSYTFDITDKCVKFMQMAIKDMPGNPGQEVLVEDLDFDSCKFITTVSIEDFGDNDFELLGISTDANINIRSNHPEAIEIIIETAEQNGELIAKQSEIPYGEWKLDDAIESGDWKIVGLDQGSEYSLLGFLL